jgi:hypothetical protein
VAGFANLIMVDVECDDPPELAEFYCRLLGWDVIGQP